MSSYNSAKYKCIDSSTTPTDTAFPLFGRILELSKADDWHVARKEWIVEEIYIADDPDACLCGHYPIRELCILYNAVTGAHATVGNCCVRHFLGDNTVGRVLDAIKCRRINGDLIEYAYNADIINGWEYSFLWSTWRKRALTRKQATVFDRLHKKIFLEIGRRSP